MKLKDALLKAVTRNKRTHKHDASCESDCEKRQDDSLHDLAARLHVLEWEAYGPDALRRRRKKSP